MEEYGETLDPVQHKKQQETPFPTLTIISHADPARMGERALLTSLSKGGKAEVSRTSTHFTAPGKAMGKPLGDPYMSRNPIIFKADRDGVLIDAQATKTLVSQGREPLRGAHRFSREELKQGVVLVIAERLVLLLHETRVERSKAPDFGFVGASDGMVTLREEIAKVADLKTPVLLRGESGTGKELAARAIHENGRANRPFVSVNMGAITPTLAASELFGAVRGSFTGASRDQGGYFKAARSGTLFLDEIGEASPEVQVMLLRALESGEISPVGAQQTIKIDTRLIAATDANLESKMKEDSFKTPLFHRLAGYEIFLPPLRDRLEDFGRLFLHFARTELAQTGELDNLRPAGPQDEPWLQPSLVLRLLEHTWPGNIRQLRNAVRQLVIGCRNEKVLRMVPKLEEMLKTAPPQTPATPTVPEPARRKPANIDGQELIEALQTHQWDIKATAEALGVSRGALYKLIEKTPELRKTTDLDPPEIQEALDQHQGNVDATAQAFKVSPRALRRRMTQLGMEPTNRKEPDRLM